MPNEIRPFLYLNATNFYFRFSMNISVYIEVMEERLAICRLPGDASLPDWIDPERFFSVTKTMDELSVVCAEGCVPTGIKAEKDWRVMKVAGPLDFEQTGIIASLVTPLAGAGIPVFVISSYDTDYLMVKSEKLMETIRILSVSCTINM